MNQHDTFLKLHTLYEKKAVRMLLKEFQILGKKIPYDIITPENAEGVIGLTLNEAALEKALFKVHMTIGKSYGNLEARRYRKEIKKFKPLPLFNEAFQKYLIDFYKREGGDRITLLTDTYIKEVVKEIEKSTELNETLIQMRDRIHRTVNSPYYYKWQAMRVARTETTFSMNAAKQVTGEVSGLTMEKVWVTAIDGRERDSHRVLNGKAIGQKEFFQVGSIKLQFPGDKTGDGKATVKQTAKELINCRCTFGYRAKRDLEGNLMWTD